MHNLSFYFVYETIASSNRNKIRIKSLKLFLLLILINKKVRLVYFVLSQSFILKHKTKQKTELNRHKHTFIKQILQL